jgi:hypothetical protein
MTNSLADFIMCGKRIGILALWASIVMQIRQLSVGITFISEFENSESSYLRKMERSHEAPLSHLPDSSRSTGLDALTTTTTTSNGGEKPPFPSLLHPSDSSTIQTTNPPPLSPEEITMKLQRSWQHVEQESYFLKVPFAIPRRRPVDHDAVTAAVHADTNRFHRLLFLIQRWKGPVSASIHIQSSDEIPKLVEFVTTYSEELAWTDIHVLMEDSPELAYPHNLLREMALRSIETEYFLAMDVDFVTTPDAYQGLHQLIRQDADLRMALHNRTWMVLPAFERLLDFKVTEDNILSIETTKPDVLPKNKLEALSLWDNDELDPFHLKRVDWGHGSTNFTRWYVEPEDRIDNNNDNNPSTTTTPTTTTNKRPSFYPISYEMGFEPYVLGCKKCEDVVLPQYWAGFRGFGYNKYTFFIEANYMGFNFAVLEDYFVVHLPHPYGKRQANDEAEHQLKLFTRYMKNNFNMTKEELDDI